MSRHINLYDPALRRQRPWLNAAQLAGMALVLLLAVLVWGVWLRTAANRAQQEANTLAEQLKTTREQSVALAAEIAARKPDPRLAQELAMLQSLLGLRRDILGKITPADDGKRVAYSEFLRGLARQSVSNLWLTGFTVGADGDMTIRGKTLEPATLPVYINRLNGEAAFRGHRFAAVKVDVPPAAESAPAAANANDKPAAPAATPKAAAGTPVIHDFALVPEHAAFKVEHKP